MERRAISVSGTVQGVGFRPFVYNLAQRLQLHGLVRNHTGGVHIEIEGDSSQLDAFLTQLKLHPPPLARIDTLTFEARPLAGDSSFRIEPSHHAAGGQVIISPDVATCDQCLAEMFDPHDRRFRYPFLNCTNCGPRLTIIQAAPYDRERTTMSGFPMCPQCRVEYEDPTNRRFHAQPTACPTCGPQLAALDAAGQPASTPDPLTWFADALRAGQIGAMKGLGGYHLACDATNIAAVAELRRRKHREDKPFALMVRTLADAEALCELNDPERELLTSSRRPIVLLHRRPATAIAPAVAPGNQLLGIMLPYTPLHHLLLAQLPLPLVMTSGNRSDEPIAYRDENLLAQLGGIADLFLVHNRPIHVRCDDSVTRVIDNQESPLRRSRGYAPQPLHLPTPCPQPILAVGGQLKGTFALGRGDTAIISHHLGDLDHFEAYRAFERDIHLYEELFDIRPSVIVHDLHPDYASTRYALERAAKEGIRTIAVQHHHAHMAGCMAEHGLTRPAIGVSFDGTGFGTDRAIWGGEFLVGDAASFRRAAHLRYVGLPGGDRAIREPWRIALAHLLDAGCPTDILRDRVDAASLRMVEAMLQKNLNTPLTSSAGRLFDAVAALAGVRDHVNYEGQAAIELEWLATGLPPADPYPFTITDNTIDTRPLIIAVASDVRSHISTKQIARRFHSTMVELITQVCRHLRQATSIDTVVLSGGVFMNALLTTEVLAHLAQAGFHVYRHTQIPPNDGGLSLGQLAVAAHQLHHL